MRSRPSKSSSAVNVGNEPVGFVSSKTINRKIYTGVLDQSIGYAIRMAQLRVYRLFAVFMSEFDIRPAQFAILVLIFENKNLTQSDAGSTLNIEKANLTGLLRGLQKRGLIERRRVEADRRSYTLHLTASGLKLIRKLIKRHACYEETISRVLGQGKEASLLALLKCTQSIEYNLPGN